MFRGGIVMASDQILINVGCTQLENFKCGCSYHELLGNFEYCSLFIFSMLIFGLVNCFSSEICPKSWPIQTRRFLGRRWFISKPSFLLVSVIETRTSNIEGIRNKIVLCTLRARSPTSHEDLLKLQTFKF